MAHPNLVGKYEIIDVLGEGAMGVVYRALDPVLGREVAIKVMNDALARDEEFRSRFMREARAAGSLQHPNVITVFDCGESDGHLYIAMEMVKGSDLEHLITATPPLSLVNKLEIMIGVLNGLGYAHKRGVVHRDVKPANIRVNEEGRALIMDFGIAHLSSSNMTRTGVMVGTPNYMAPEQVVGGEISPRTDIFAMGVVLYELLTNTRPFEGANLHSVLYKIVSEAPPPPEKVVTGLRPDLTLIVNKALAKEPADRYASTTEMAAALSKVLGILSNSGSVAQTLSLRATIELARQSEEAQRVEQVAPPAEKPARERRNRPLIAASVVGALLVAGIGGWAATHRAAPSAVPQSATSPTAATSSAAPAQPSAAPAAAAAAPAPVNNGTTAPVASASAVARAHVPEPAGALAARANPSAPARQQPVAGAGGANAAPAVDPAARPTTTAVTAAPAAPTAAATQPPPTPAANPSREIGALITEYSRAIDSRDVDQLRQAYPGITSQQAGAFDDFFKAVKSIHASFVMSNLQVDGASAEASLAGAYDFVTSNGRSEHQPLTLHAQFRHDANGWRITSIR